MLKELRNRKTQKTIFIFLAVVVVVTFAISGVIINQDENSAPSSLGRIDNKKVTFQQYLSSYKAVQHQAAWMYGEQYNEIRRFLNLQGEAWDRLLLLGHAKRENIHVPDKDVVGWLTTQQAFLNKGVFDPGFYRMYVKNQLRLEPREFEEEIRQFLSIQKINEKIRAGIRVSDEEVKSRYIAEKAERDIQYASLPWESLKDSVTVDEKEINTAYESRKESMASSEKARIQAVFVPKDRLTELEAALADKTSTPAELSKKFNLPLEETPLYSKDVPAPGTNLSAEIQRLGFSLKDKETSGWVRLSEGAYNIQLIEKIAAETLTPEAAKQTIKDELIKPKAQEAAVKKLNAALKNPAEAGLEIKTVEKWKSGDKIEALGDTNQILNLKEGEWGSAFITPEGAAAAKLLKLHPIDEKKFSEEKEAFKKSMVDEKVNQEMRALIDRLRKRLVVDTETMKKVFAE